jgi:hypothetical protein
VGAYYYLVSQLPSLVYGQKPPMLPEAFKELAKPMLNAEDAALLDTISLDPSPSEYGVTEGGQHSTGITYAEQALPSGSDFIDGWREWERTLRLNLARQRAIKVKREGVALAEPPIIPADAASAAHGAMTVVDSPLEADIFLDKARWSAIESLQGVDYFDRNMVFAYLLKLLILERRAAMQPETGFSEYKSLYASIMNDVTVFDGVQTGVSPAGESK